VVLRLLSIGSEDRIPPDKELSGVRRFMELGWKKYAFVLGMLPLCCLGRLRVKDSFDVYTQCVDNQRSAVNLTETELSQSNVKTRFGKLWTLYSDAKIMARPLYVSHLVSANIFKDAEP